MTNNHPAAGLEFEHMEEKMTDKQKELKPCPFCGGEAVDDIYIRDGRQVSCKNCGAYMAAFNPDANIKAIEAWNTRAALSEPEAVEVDWLIDEFEDIIGDCHDIDVTDRDYAIAVIDYMSAQGYIRTPPQITHGRQPITQEEARDAIDSFRRFSDRELLLKQADSGNPLLLGK